MKLRAGIPDHARMLEVLAVAVLLLVLAVCGLAWALLRRVDALAVSLRELARLEGLERHLDAVAARIEGGAGMENRLTSLTESSQRLSAAVAELRSELLAPASGPSERSAPGPAESVRRHLAAQGYADIHVLTDLSTLPPEGGKVVFEARRQGVVHKGSVVYADGDCSGEQVQTAWAAFP